MSDQPHCIRYPLPVGGDGLDDQIPVYRPRKAVLAPEVEEAHALYRAKLAEFYAPHEPDRAAPTLAEVEAAYDLYRQRVAEWQGEDAA